MKLYPSARALVAKMWTILLFLGSRSYADSQVPAAASKIPLLVFQGSLPSRVALIRVNFLLL